MRVTRSLKLVTEWLLHVAIRIFFFYRCYVHDRDLHSFPTRRSSDLVEEDTMDLGLQGRKAIVCASSRGLGKACARGADEDRKSTRLNSSHMSISYAVFCLKKKTISGQPWLHTTRCPVPQRA